jgi:hypothetical protein
MLKIQINTAYVIEAKKKLIIWGELSLFAFVVHELRFACS